MPTREILRAVTQWTPGYQPQWTIGQVRSALRLHADGDFSQSSLLWEAFGEDPVFADAIEKWTGAIVGSDFELCPVDAPNRRLSKRIVDQFEPIWWDIYPEGDLEEWLGWYRGLGVAVAVHDDWQRGTHWKPRLKVLHPQYLRRDQIQEKWLYNAQEGQLEVTPGDGKWLLLIDGRRGWMRAAVRALALTWISAQLTSRDWNRYNERHGLPLLKAKAPMIAEEGDRDEWFEDLQGLQSDMVAMLLTHVDGQSKDAAYDLELLEAKDQSHASFEKHLERLDRKVQVYLIGGNLSSEVVDQGARAAADTHRGVERSKATAGAKKLSTELRRQGLFPVVAYNVEQVRIEVIPWPKWDTEPPEDEKAESEADEAFGKALKAIGDAGYDVENAEELAEQRGLKIKRRPTPEPPAAPPAQPAAPPGQAQGEPDQRGSEPKAERGSRTVASGFLAAKASGFLNGQLYADQLTDEATASGVREIEVTVDAVLEELDAATDYDDLRRRLRARYQDLKPDALTELVYRAMVMGELAGRHAVNEDT